MRNNHLVHLEDLVFKDSELLKTILNSLSLNMGHFTIKYDGAPAVFIGQDETSFFVSTKSIFNKTPKFYRSVDEISHSFLKPKLKEKLIEVYNHFKDSIDGHYIVQGDFLFSESDLKTETIQYKEYVTFHPNTIIYAYPKNFKHTKIGVAWHTYYDLNLNKIEGTPLIDMNGGFNPVINLYLDDEIINVENIQKTVDRFPFVQYDEEIVKELMIYINSKVRAGYSLYGLSYKNCDEFREWNSTRKCKLDFSKIDAYILDNHFYLHKKIESLKLHIINKLNRNFPGLEKMFVKSKDTHFETSHEGFVYNVQKNAVKFVDRDEFSYYNFTSEFDKGWT